MELPKSATRGAWKTRPLPTARAALSYSRTFDRVEHDRLERGLVPDQMEDKWFIFLEEPWLFFHRSWTGTCIYALRLRADGDGFAVEEAWVNRAPEEYRETDDAYDTKVLAFLVDRLLLGLDVPFPLREHVDPAKASMFIHSVVGNGRSNDEGSGS
jgi:hypothetical protein